MAHALDRCDPFREEPSMPDDKNPTPVATPLNRNSKPQHDPNQGEGDKVSAHRYESHLRRFIKSGGVEPAARDAAAAVDSNERADLLEAERRGRAPASITLLDRALGVGRRVRRAVQKGLEELKTPDDHDHRH
jgi:hypothetical protein